MDKRESAYVLWFDELRRSDVGLVGGKSSSLGELTSSVDVPVPYGFATTATAYRYFMEKPDRISGFMSFYKIYPMWKIRWSFMMYARKFVKVSVQQKCRRI